jgi:hypothetical protein
VEATNSEAPIRTLLRTAHLTRRRHPTIKTQPVEPAAMAAQAPAAAREGVAAEAAVREGAAAEAAVRTAADAETLRSTLEAAGAADPT